MKRIVLALSIIALITYSLFAYSRTVVNSWYATTDTSTYDLDIELDRYHYVYLETYLTGSGYVKTDVQAYIGDQWVTVLDDDSTGAEYGQITIKNPDSLLVTGDKLRLVNITTVNSGTVTLDQSITGQK